MTKRWLGRPKYADVARCFRKSVVDERARLGLSQKEFAKLMMVSYDAIRSWERGRKVGVEHVYYLWTRGPLAAADVARRIIESCY